MAEKRNPVPTAAPDFVPEAEKAMEHKETARQPRDEVTIKFGKGLVGDPFTSKNGKQLVKIHIPNPDPVDTRPWESFVISPKMIHENQFGKGVWMKLPADGITRLSRPVKTGVDASGRPTWDRETREVANTDLKRLMESYKDKSRSSVLSDLSERKETAAAAKPPGKAAKKKEAAR